MSNNIVLIGMRGSGKTTVSKILGEKLGFSVVDSDFEISVASGMAIADLAAKRGWQYFRDKETEFLKNFKSDVPYILSTGGGMPVREINQKLLKKSGSVYYLFAEPEILTARIADLGDNRAIITGAKTFLEDQKKLYEERKAIYESVADQIIHTELIGPEEVAETILAYYQFVHKSEYHS